jgi:hypothetical protein
MQALVADCSHLLLISLVDASSDDDEPPLICEKGGSGMFFPLFPGEYSWPSVSMFITCVCACQALHRSVSDEFRTEPQHQPFSPTFLVAGASCGAVPLWTSLDVLRCWYHRGCVHGCYRGWHNMKRQWKLSYSHSFHSPHFRRIHKGDHVKGSDHGDKNWSCCAS